MLIVCPNCANSYDVAPEKLGPAGRSVRCVRCRMVWFAAPPAETVAWAESGEEGAEGVETDTETPVSVPETPPEATENGKFGWTYEPERTAEVPPTHEDTAEPAPSEAETGAESTEEPTKTAPEHTALAVISDEAPPAPVAASEEPSHAPILDQEASPPQVDEPEPPSNVENLAARRAKRPAKRTWRPWKAGLPMAVIALAAIMVGLVAGRQKIVRFVPQTASLYGAIGLGVNLRGLAFENVKTTREVADGVTVLVIEGTVVSVANKTVEVPRLRFGVRNAAGLEVYAWTTMPARTILPPGETVEFRSRLASPPADARDVVVRFFNRRDVIASAH